MLQLITKALNIDTIPRWILFYLGMLSILSGCFNAFFFITAFSEFLIIHNLSFYPQVITCSGIVGVLLFNAYKYFFKKFAVLQAFMSIYIILALLILAGEFLPHFLPSAKQPLILLGLWLPITIIAEQTFLKVALDIPFIKVHYNTKRFLEFGIISGSVLCGIVVTVLISYVIKIPFTAFAISCLLLVVTGIFFLSKRLKYNPGPKQEEAVDSLIAFLSEVPLKKTVLVITLFSLLSILTFVITEYSFLSVISNVYIHKTQIKHFMGFFLAVTMSVNLLFKLFVYQNLIKTFKINKALKLSPLFILVILLVIYILTLLPQLDNLYGPYSFIFVSIVFCRLFSFLLRESFEFYSLRLFFSALETYVQKTIAGFLGLLLNFWSFIFAGLILLMINLLKYPTLNLILVVNICFAFIWLLVAIELSKNYSITLSSLIKKLSNEYKSNDQEKDKNLKERIMVTANLSGIRYLLNYQRNFQPGNFQKTIQFIPQNLQTTLGINGDNTSYDPDESIKTTSLELLAVSTKIKDRILAIRIIGSSSSPKFPGILKMLLRDPEDEVKRNAIQCAATNYNAEIILELSEYLEHEEFSDLTADVLATIGDEVIGPLSNLFQKSGITTDIQRKIIKIIGNIGTEKAVIFLLDKLVYPNKWIVLEATNALIEKKHIVALNDKGLINKAINNTIAGASWLLAMDVSIQDISHLLPIKRALAEEYELTLDLLFDLLQLKYSEGVIRQAKKYLTTDTANEQRELSVEMLDHILEKDIKSYLFPLIHNNRKKEKVLQLQNLYPIGVKNTIEALREMINSDLSDVSAWTKACALDAYSKMQDVSQSEDVYAHVFNPEPLLSEIAFWGIYKWNKEASFELFSRLPNQAKKKFSTVNEPGEHFEYQLLFYKVISLQKISYFEKTKGHYLIPLAQVLSDNFLYPGCSTYLQCSEEEILPIFIVPYGDMTLIDAHKRKFRVHNNQLYGLGLPTEGITLKSATGSVVYLAKPERIGSLVLNHDELSIALHKYIQNSNFY